jgi:DNA polymerase III subunit epsilon
MAGRTPPPRGPRVAALQLELGAADRLAALIEESGEPLPPERAAGALLALPRVPGELARRVLDEVVQDDARLVRHEDGRVGLIGLAPPPSTPLDGAAWTVVDLETTGVGASARIVEIGAVRLEGDRQVGTLSRLVDPGIPMPPRITQITGIRDRDLAGAGPLRPAIGELLALARGSIFVAHNASFDVGMLDRALMRLDGTRVGMRVLDTVALARRLLAGRLARFDLASVSERFDVTVRPCHRALPDALATAEVLVALIGLAQERGAETAEDVMALALAPPRRARQQRHLAAGLPAGPGVYVMRDRLGQALYVGKAGDLRTRVRSYFGPRRQPPRIEGALAALTRIDSAPTGSELEAALCELDLIRRWRPPGNVRDKRPDKAVYLRLGLAEHAPALGVREAVRDDGAVYAGPFPSRRRATDAAEALRDAYGLRTCRPRVPVDDGRCLRGAAGRCLAPCRGGDDALAYARSARALAAWLEGDEAVLDAPLRERVARLIAQHRFEDARRTTTLIDSVRAIDAQVATIRRAARRTGVLLASDLDPRHVVAFAVVRGALVAKRRLPRAGDPGLELGVLAQALERALDPAAQLAPRAEGPWLPAERSAEALLLAQAFAGRAPGVVPIACTAPDALVLKRVDGARRRVPLRVALPPGRHARPDELAAVA